MALLRFAERAADLQLAADLRVAAVADDAQPRGATGDAALERSCTSRSGPTPALACSAAASIAFCQRKLTCASLGRAHQGPSGDGPIASQARSSASPMRAKRGSRSRSAASPSRRPRSARVGRRRPRRARCPRRGRRTRRSRRRRRGRRRVAHQQLAARRRDRRGGARVLVAGAGVDLAVLRRAQAIGIGQVARADLGQQLVARRDRLRLERLGRRRRRHLRRHQPGQQLVLGHGVDHRQLAAVVERDVELAEVAARLACPPRSLSTSRSSTQARRARLEPDDGVVADDGAALVDGLDGAARPLDQLGVQRCRRCSTARRLAAASSSKPLDGDQHAPAVEHLPLDREERAHLEGARRILLRAPARQLGLQLVGRRAGANDATTTCQRDACPACRRRRAPSRCAPPRTSAPPSPSGSRRIAGAGERHLAADAP